MKKTIAFILSLPLLLLFSCTASLFPDMDNEGVPGWFYAYNLQTITGIRPVNNN